MYKIIIILLLLFSHVFAFNKVQYKKYDWKESETDHFAIYFYGTNSAVVSKTAYFLERAFGNLSNRLKFYPKKKIKVVLYNSPNEFQQTNITQGYIGEGTGGFTEFLKKRVVIPFDGDYLHLRHVVHHELLHAFVYSMYENKQNKIATMKSLSHLPLWLHEGMAEYFSQEWTVDVDLYVRDAVVHGLFNRYPIDAINGYLMYKVGESFCRYIAITYNEESLVKLIKEMKKSSFKSAFKKVFSKEFKDVYKDWLNYVSKEYWKDVKNYDLKIDGTPITEHFKDLTYININPAISYSDSLIAYFTDRYDYMNLVVKNIRTKKIVAKVSSMVSSNFESFHPFYSSISWSSDNNYLYYSGLSQGKDVIFKYSLKDKKNVKEYVFSGLNSIRSPFVSPLNDCIVFEGKKEDLENIYVYYFDSKQIVNLGNDIDFDFNPTIGKDGSHVYFVKEHFDSIPDIWNYKKEYRLMSYNLINKKFEILYKSKFKIAWPKQVGDYIYFIDYTNISPNLMQLDINSKKAVYKTGYFTGITNFTIGKNRIAFSYLNNFGYDISYIMLDSLKTKKYVDKDIKLKKNFSLKYSSKVLKKKKDLNHKKALDSLVRSFKNKRREYIGNIKINKNIDTLKNYVDLKSDTLLEYKDYSVEMSLDMANVGVGYNTLTGYNAQSYILLSDVLSSHQIALYLNGTNINIDNLSFGVSYNYLPNRWNFHFDFYTFPYFSDNYYLDSNTLLSSYKNTSIDQNIIGNIGVKYPFSIFNAINFDLSLNSSSRNYKKYNFVTSKYDNDKTENSESISFYKVNLGYTFDNRLWGNFGPINGHLTDVDFNVNSDFNKSSFGIFNLLRRDYFRINRAYNFANSFRMAASMPFNRKNNNAIYYVGGMNMDILNYQGFDNSSNLTNLINMSVVTPLRGYDLYSSDAKNYLLNNFEFRFPFIENLTFYWPLRFGLNYIGGAFFWDQAYLWNMKKNAFLVGDKFFDNFESGYLYGYGVGLRINLGYYILKMDWALESNKSSFLKMKKFYLTLNGEF